MPAWLAPALVGVGSSLLPFLLQKIAGNYDAAQMAKAPAPMDPMDYLVSTGLDRSKIYINPANPSVYYKVGPRGIGKTAFPVNMPNQPVYTYPGMKGVRTAYNTAGMLGNAIGMAAPYLFNLLGRGTQAAAVTAGAGAQALANIPAHLANMKSSAQREAYGGTPLDALGGILSDVGGAAGTGISAIGNAAGGTLQDIGNTMQMMQMQRRMNQMMAEEMQRVKEAGLSGHEWDYMGRTRSALAFPRY